ncbi:efflux transporter, outer membrane factor (OMF) lipoprotein, NodT family [Hymenobacter gelipurpurascens]|uniref:Efflux transporter, outer membrane factor (OMF) lipoprotein, NodT family n=1 Tax=Hymenobacter gelipurpurascens TaxID=89968 RepID=A0A212U945_9BACT|nr:efflux transporter outer membrane subunit [Hymenobacter gelipurpurascens]SNC74792.1 efflux transporter, outer membrane factor (OMF) lipoprotein, NodT family [Hymenobacter gelipurpurascens]
MLKRRIYQGLSAALLTLAVAGCKTPELVQKTASRNVPASYGATQDSTNTAQAQWKQFFTDPNLTALIDTALQRNQELNISLQEIQISRNEVQIRKGEYLPFVGLGAKAETERPSRNTLQGATEEAISIKPEHRNPDPLPNYQVGAFASWEVDIWHKLRNSRKSAALRYLATVEGRNFTITNLISEIATSYYELLALDNQLAIVKQNIELQSNALELVRLQKESARTTELAVQRFEAQVHNTRSLQYTIQQRIIETENRINFLVGRYPQPIVRNDASFNDLLPTAVQTGVPAQLLQNRPDIRQAEQSLAATKLDVQIARANFYPSVRITGSAGFAAFKSGLLFSSPESMLFSLAGDLVAPLVNRNGIKAVYGNANAVQIQAAYQYERTILNAYVEVANQLASINNLAKSYDEKAKAVQALNQSATISNSLFRSARADYTEVLFTQRDALESKFDLIETRMQQLNATVNVYRALGGGWK